MQNFMKRETYEKKPCVNIFSILTNKQKLAVLLNRQNYKEISMKKFLGK